MTAEIAVLNRHAVALAADSAVTVESGDGQKIYNTVNKLFALSKFAPVAVMVYGNAEITGVPWETVIKQFRRELDKTRFGTLEQYSDALLAFLENHQTLFPRDQQRNDVTQYALSYLSVIRRDIAVDLARLFPSPKGVSRAQIAAVVASTIQRHFSKVQQLADLPGCPVGYAATIEKEFDAELSLAIGRMFQRLPLTAGLRKSLKTTAALIHCKDIWPENLSGVVVAGFGDEQHYPHLISSDIQGVVGGKVKHRRRDSLSINADNSAIIIPFAQHEMVDMFMDGIDPAFRDTVEIAIEGFLKGLPKTLLAGLSPGPRDRARLRRAIDAASGGILAKFRQELGAFSKSSYSDPIVSAVAALPKEQLAEMAESLVNLTSFKRRVTMDPETVGGPIDVAVVSKGDGLIWIRRKHYFRPELNHHFFANYFQTV